MSHLSVPATPRDLVIDEVIGGLLSIAGEWQATRLGARALASDDPADGSDDELGDPPGNRGAIENGELLLVVGADLGGTWSGVRP